MMRSALNAIDAHSETTMMVGDRMDTDVVSGMEAGMRTILVLTGSTKAEDVERFPYQPTRVVTPSPRWWNWWESSRLRMPLPSGQWRPPLPGKPATGRSAATASASPVVSSPDVAVPPDRSRNRFDARRARPTGRSSLAPV